MAYHRNYCSKCDWYTSTETHSRHEVASSAIGHFIETQHIIESEPVAELGNGERAQRTDGR